LVQWGAADAAIVHGLGDIGINLFPFIERYGD
jgi:hypothetical protein